MHKNVTLPLFLACLIASSLFVIGVSSCFEKPEPDCEPPPPEQCEYDGQILWPDPLCAYECVMEDKRTVGAREI